MKFQTILDSLPYESPFLFVDELIHLDESSATGHYTFNKNLDFYKGHFKGKPVTPGVILTECCAQIGLVCLGLFLLANQKNALDRIGIGFSSSQMEFLKPVFPGEKVKVSSKLVYFRFSKLKCEVKMHDTKGELVCKGVLAGMIKTDDDG